MEKNREIKTQVDSVQYNVEHTLIALWQLSWIHFSEVRLISYAA